MCKTPMLMIACALHYLSATNAWTHSQIELLLLPPPTPPRAATGPAMQHTCGAEILEGLEKVDFFLLANLTAGGAAGG